MRAIVCGSRDCEDENFVFANLDAIHAETPITLIIEGGQRKYLDGRLIGGVDLHACRWGYRNGLPGLRFDAEWQKLGKAAGPIRNARMLREGKPDVVIAFPGGRGTNGMVRLAEDAGVPVVRVAA